MKKVLWNLITLSFDGIPAIDMYECNSLHKMSKESYDTCQPLQKRMLVYHSH